MEMKSGTGKLVGRLLGYTWLCALGVALIFSALTTDRRARQVEEYPCCCDPFGYLQMAQDMRDAVASGRDPQFIIESPHTRLLIELMQSRHVPLAYWEDMVAPLAYHYFPRADHVGVQYPPGAGFMLALFPQDKALHGLDLLVIALFLASGLVMLVLAGAKRAWLAAGFLTLSLDLGLEILGEIDNASFSINAMLAPLLLSGLCLFTAFGVRTDSGKSLYLAWFLTFLAGLLFGVAVLTRLPVILLMPGLLVLLWPAKLRSWYKSAWSGFILGVLLGGVVPLSIHQSRLSGAWYLPTYPRYDATRPTLERFWPNVSYYFGPGKASTDNWALPVISIGCIGLFLLSTRRAASHTPATFLRRLNWGRLLMAALLIWGLSTAYFLTHQIAIHYYPMPATFGTVLLLALGAFSVEDHKYATSKDRGWLRRALQFVALALALAPGLIVIGRVWSNYVPASVERRPPRFSLPAELSDERAWIWANELSGTLWYYARKPAHKISSSNGETRALVYEFVISRGEPQYIVGADPGMKPVEDEIVQFGGTLELRGEVDGYSYFLIHWPPNGPVKRAAL